MFSKNLAIAQRYFAGVVVGLALFGFSNSTSAATITLGVQADPTTGSYSTFSFGGNDYQVFVLSIPVDPFQLTSGDTVNVTVGLLSALTIPSGGNQYVGLNFEPRDGDGLNLSVNGTMTFSGGVGAPVGPQSSNFSGSFSNVFYTSGPAFSFTNLLSSAVYTFDGGPLTFSEISVSYQVDSPSQVPVPGALALFAAGVAGFGWLTRRRRMNAV